ncbi:RNA 3'-terminal phosphate cyclase [Stemphylium lycopersici]|nr:RNA 3'-terminal phosphate cyclase [Stemphylium lycopersici]
MTPTPGASSSAHLEGTTLEGGGQLLRIALGLSTLTKKPISITNIRGRRSGGGGLKAQHLTSLQWLGEMCNAKITGSELKSRTITYVPDTTRSVGQHLQTGEVRIQQSTPGSVSLVLQAILPYVLFSGAQLPIYVRITGGTNVSNSPSYDYITQVLLPMLQLIGIPQIDTQLHSRGWSQGTASIGSATFTIMPLTTKLSAFQLLDRGNITSISATIIAPKHTDQHFREELDVMFERRLSRFSSTNSKAGKEPDTIITFEDSHHEKRYYLLLVATTSAGMKLGRDWLYDGGSRPGKQEQVIPSMVKKVSDDLLAELGHGGCVDEYLRDQLVVFQALAVGRSHVYGGRREDDMLVRPSLHTKTAQWVAKEILGVEFDEQGSCEGIGFYVGSKGATGEEEKEVVQQLSNFNVIDT